MLFSKEILVSYERYCKIYKINSVINRIPVKCIVLINLVVAIVLNIPDFLALTITFTGTKDVYIYTFSEFGKTVWYGIYVILLFATLQSISVTSLSTLNILIVKGYRNFIRTKMKLVKRNEYAKKDLQFQKTLTWIVCQDIYLY